MCAFSFLLRSSRLLLPLAAALSSTLLTAPAFADRLVIKNPGQHPNYTFEAEPHLALGFFDFGPGDDDGIGLGFRGTIPIVENGFVSTINNSVGIGFGVDWLSYDHHHCHDEPRGVRVCDEHDIDRFWIPVVMQWNFWLSENWSVFGEPGLSIRFDDRDDRNDRDGHMDIDPTLFLGGRFALSDAVQLTMRLGHPTFTFGVSFLL